MAEGGSSAELGRVTACFNHRDREGRVRCGSCLRPVCEECVIIDPAGRKYCTQKCLDGATAARERADDLSSRPRPAGQFPLVSILMLIGLAMGGWYAFKHWKMLLALYHRFVG